MKPKITTHPNGLRILTVTLPDAQTSTVMHMVAVGSKYEKDTERGLSHFLEHMCFKGTSTYNTPKKLALAFDEKGIDSNAFTSYEYTGYYAKGPARHTSFYIDIISDIFLHSTFPEEEIQKEKGVILEEIKLGEDLPFSVAQEDMMKLLYADQPAARSILGTPESVSSFTQKDFRKYHTTFYQPNNSLIVIAGPEKHGALITKIKKQFAHIPSVPVPKKKKVNDVQKVSGFSYRERKVDQMHLVAGFRSVRFADKDAMTAEALASVLGRGMSSRLFSKVREELGGAYYVKASHDGLSDHGIFSISAGIDTARAPLILSEIARVLEGVKKEKVPSLELAKAKEILKSAILMGLESTDAIASYYATFAILGQPLKSPKELIKEIDKVTSADVQRLAKKLFVKERGVLAIVGPKKDDSLKDTFFDCLRSGGMVG